jgi:hypothetical protein
MTGQKYPHKSHKLNNQMFTKKCTTCNRDAPNNTRSTSVDVTHSPGVNSANGRRCYYLVQLRNRFQGFADPYIPTRLRPSLSFCIGPDP